MPGKGWRVLAALLAVPTFAAAGVYVWLFLRSVTTNPTLEHLIALLFMWQIQTGDAFALAAALIGAAVVLDQTATTRRLEEIRRARRATALRAVLPLMLTEISDYASRCAGINARLLAQPSNTAIRENRDLGFPDLPAGVVDRLIDLIEASERDHARPLIILAKRVQISSRTNAGHAKAGERQGREHLGWNQRGSSRDRLGGDLC